MTTNYKLCHLRNLIVLSKADGKELPEEAEFISSIIGRESLTEEDQKYCIENLDAIDNAIPDNYNERMEYLYDLIKLMVIDGHVDEKELEICKECAEMMKIPSDSVENLVNNLISLIHKDMGEADSTDRNSSL